MIIGIGINVNMVDFPAELKNKATSFFLETKKKINRLDFAVDFFNIFDTYYKKFVENQSFRPFVEKYNSMLVNRGKEVKIYYGMVESAKPEEIETGIAKGVDEYGALHVMVDGQEKRVVAGEVSVRGVMDYV